MKIENNIKGKTIKPKKNLGIVILSAVGILALSGAIWYGLTTALQTEDYYVLNRDVAGKSQVTEEMLSPITTSKGSAPQNAISLNQVKQGAVYTKIPLKTGDVLSASNTGINFEAGIGIPDDWVVTSINISADDAVGGNIAKGDYFDILGVSTEEGAKYLFHNVLALDMRVNEDDTTVDKEGKVVPLGETIQYIIGMPAKDAAVLHHSLKRFESIKMLLSPTSIRYRERAVEDLTPVFFLNPSDYVPVDLYEGTDPTFTPVLKDENGRPVTHEACELGQIADMTLCDKLPPKQEVVREKAKDVSLSTNGVLTETNEETQVSEPANSTQPEEEAVSETEEQEGTAVSETR